MSKVASDYRAVSIVARLGACQAAQELREERFLSHDAPMLPLNDCGDPANCRCRYQHWEDRRQDSRRMADDGIATMAYYGEEKREGRRGRRADD